MFLGIASGLLAGALWGFVFLAPKVLTDYSAADIALGRYAVFGAVSAVLLCFRFKRLKSVMTWPLTVRALLLSCLSFSVYYFTLSSSIKYGGIVPASLISGLLPVTIPLASHDKIARRGLFAVSLMLILVGLFLLNAPLLLGISSNPIDSAQWLIGLFLAGLAVALWTAYAPLNAKVLAKNPDLDSITWSSLLGVFAFLTMVPLWGVFGETSLSAAPRHFFALPYVLWMFLIGAGSSWLAIYFWNNACRRIPTALAGQLIVSEVVFSLIYNYIYEWSLPTINEWSAALVIILGVIVGIRSFSEKRGDERLALCQVNTPLA